MKFHFDRELIEKLPPDEGDCSAGVWHLYGIIPVPDPERNNEPVPPAVLAARQAERRAAAKTPRRPAARQRSVAPRGQRSGD